MLPTADKPHDDESNSSQTETLSQKIEDKLMEAQIDPAVVYQEPVKAKIDEDLSTMTVMKRIFNLAIFPIIAMLFHPSYHICNSIILG